MNQTESLAQVLAKYAVPDPKIVNKLPKGGMQLDFVGHADITRLLIEIDPLWTWEPIAYTTTGLPAYEVINGMAQMAGRMTVHGKTLIGVGSCQHNKPDLLKELISDFIRNAAMRFGICLSLWTKNEWEDLGGIPPAKPAKPKVTAISETRVISQKADLEAVTKFIHVCAQNNIDHDRVADHAGVNLSEATEADMNKLRAAYKEIKEGAKK